MSVKRKSIIGLGTGRCGTTSLATILSLQEDSYITHELGRDNRLPWKTDRILFNHYWDAIHSNSHACIGDIAFYLLPYISLILEKNKNTRIIVLKREKKKTISSYMKHTPRRNHWVSHRGVIWRKDRNWDKCYPKYKIRSKKAAISRFYDDYYHQCQRIRADNIFWIATEDLNNEAKVIQLLEFCGFSNPVFKKVTANQG